MKGRRGHAEEHENSERWLVTYADMLTLLMVLFVVLYAMSQVDQTKFRQLSSSLASAFNGGQKSVFEGTQGLMSDSSNSISPELGQQDVQTGIDQGLPQSSQSVKPASAPTNAAHDAQTTVQRKSATDPAETARLQALGMQITRALDAAGMPGAATTAIDQRGLVVSVVTTNVIFNGNSADLLAGGQQVMNVIAPLVAPLPNAIEVDGNTNQQQVSTYPYPSGWELSAARASSVVRYLAAHGIPQSRLSAVGYSDQRPLYPPSDPRSVTLNRRVDVVVLAQ